MATIPSPRTWVTGEVVTAAEMNTDIRDAVKFLLGGASSRKPSFRVSRAANQSIANNTTTTILWDTTGEDTDSGYNSGTGIYTVATAGLWLVTTSAVWASNGTGQRLLTIQQNGGNQSVLYIGVTFDTFGRSSLAVLLRAGVGDTFNSQVNQTSGGALNFISGDAGFNGAWINA